ncbi:MAG: deoxyhypusine synthase [Verrucomicrobia bacterium]|nr:deoxyhypusine synthase [Verrucomicrobiota bacterium]
MAEGPITKFIDRNYRHFNSAVVRDAAIAYRKLLDDGGRMMVTLAGAMSTAELGISLAEMIRKGKVHAISCTGANLEEDVYNLVAHDHYRRVPGYRYLTAKDEDKLLKEHLNRVTDTCIPEHEAMRRIEGVMIDLWKRDEKQGARKFPHEYFFEALREGLYKKFYQIDPKDSWMVAAANMLPRVEYMISLADFYTQTAKTPLGFFQIGGGIAGDFPICVVPMLHQDLKRKSIPLWAYFCQISDSTTSYGSYSGAVPNEKITWGKLGQDTPSFVIESDATIVAPLMFSYILGH